jgi:hypothetical protein
MNTRSLLLTLSLASLAPAVIEPSKAQDASPPVTTVNPPNSAVSSSAPSHPARRAQHRANRPHDKMVAKPSGEALPAAAPVIGPGTDVDRGPSKIIGGGSDVGIDR